jgi:hypothetical protein
MAERPILKIIPAPRGATLVFLVDAVVIEDDTHLVLGADPVPRETREEPGQLLENARASIQPVPGTFSRSRARSSCGVVIPLASMPSFTTSTKNPRGGRNGW